ncbi:MAG: hypothetical protein ACRD5R_05120 [Candidatus Acidiferrales bacterium]
MTKKDYVAIAATLDHVRRINETAGERRGTQRAARCLADMMAADNLRFDRARFLKACGVQS